MPPTLDWLRGSFIYIVAFALPLAGAVIAVWRFSQGDREDGARIAAAALLGACVYAIWLM
ncbi:MAG: hypothetical protein M3401_06530 [Actinomycetota bacterium]|nr:hypothetical protein [Actinomycetota bacterium]